MLVGSCSSIPCLLYTSGYDELATVNGKLAQVVKIAGDEVTLQVFEGTEGIQMCIRDSVHTARQAMQAGGT